MPLFLVITMALVKMMYKLGYDIIKLFKSLRNIGGKQTIMTILIDFHGSDDE